MTDIPISFTLDLVDNINATVNRLEQSVGKLDAKLEDLHTKTTAQNIDFIAQVQAVRSVDMGFRGLVNVAGELGLVTGGLETGLRKVSIAVHGVSASFQLLKGARQVLVMLRNAEIGVAVVEAYRAGLKGKMGLVLLGIASAAAAGGYLAGRANVSNETNVTQNVTFGGGTPGADSRAMARDMLIQLGGY
jgi:hypothetical protein